MTRSRSREQGQAIHRSAERGIDEHDTAMRCGYVSIWKGVFEPGAWNSSACNF
jgi:hypothetical protein